MTVLVRCAVFALLGVATWKVYGVRERLAHADADPAAVASLEERLRSLPLAVGDYRGAEEPMDTEMIRQAGADCYTSVRYRDPQGNEFRVYIGGSIANEENFHAPTYCMPSHGWENVDESTIPFTAYAVGTAEPRMRRMLAQKGASQQLIYYWFQAGRRIADHDLAVRWFRFLDLLADEPFRPTLIVTIYMPVKKDVQRTEEAAAKFLHAMGPHLHAAISGD